MKVLKIKEQNALFDYLEENVGWFAPHLNARNGAGFTDFFWNLNLPKKIPSCRARNDIRSF